MLATTALFFAALSFGPDQAWAACTITVAGSVACSAATTTTPSTNTNGATASSSDRTQTWNNGTPIAATVDAAVSGSGLALVEAGATPEFITIVNNSSISSSGSSGLLLTGNGNFIQYTGAGSVTGGLQGIVATNTSNGTISITPGGTVSAGGGNNGIQTSAADGLTTIDLTNGTIAGSLSGAAGISSTSSGGGITITATNIATSGSRAGQGIVASASAGTGLIQVTERGALYATTNGINVSNNGVGGVAVNLNNGGEINSTGGTGELIRVTGAGGGITVTNAAGSQIDPLVGVDAQINNAADTSNVVVHQNGSIATTLAGGVGIIAATNGTGNVQVDGSGNVQGGNGAATWTVGASPVTAANVGILAAQIGTLGGVTISGSGQTTGNNAIVGLITNSSNTSDILIDRSGAISVTGTNGIGVYAKNDGTGLVTVQNTGAITGASVAYGIQAIGAGGNVLVKSVGDITANGSPGNGIVASTVAAGSVTVDGTGIITAANNGISATTPGTGNVLVTHTGAITATAGTGIIAKSVGGTITVTPSSTVSGANGIDAETTSNGTVTVTTASLAAGNVTGTGGYGLTTSAQDGATLITNNAAKIQGSTFGVTAASRDGKITISGSGDFKGGSAAGISAIMSGGTGTGPGLDGILINGTGNTTSTTGDGIVAQITQASNSSNITIVRSGSVTAGGNGIIATTAGVGDVTVSGVGANGGSVSGTAGTGIDAESLGGKIVVNPSGTVSGVNGILGTTTAAGTVTVTTAFGAAGNVTGSTGYGIQTSAQNGNTIVTNNAAQVSGATFGVNSTATGTGTITITDALSIGSGAYIGGTGAGIKATLSGANASTADGIIISGQGNTSATTGVGIDAQITDSGNKTNINITRSGTVSVAAGGGDGINATTIGGGNVTVTGTGNVTAGTGGAAIGINASSTGGNGNVSVTPLGFVSGGNGINTVSIGTGTNTVTTASGSAGNVTGSNGYGIQTSAAAGNTIVTNNAVFVSGTTSADNSTSTGIGTLTIRGTGDYVGGTVSGITATLNGVNASTADGIIISGTGNTSATTGVGIDAQITNNLNNTNINITRSGTVTVTTAGSTSDGINAVTAGLGSVTVSGVGNVTGGTGAGAIGINAQNTDNGASKGVSVTPAGTVSGTNGIQATNAGTNATSTVTVTTANGAAGNVTGSAGYGIQTSAVTGNTIITNNAASVSGTTWAATATSTGTGIITITDGAPGTGAGLYAGGTLGGINAQLTGANAATTDGIIISGAGNTTSTTGVGINATILAGNNTNINITRSGTTTVQTAGSTSNGINAVTGGLGSVTVNGVGNVTGGTGAGAIGINAQNNNAGASKGVSVTPAGTVSGTNGIQATNTGTNATSTVTVTTANGAAGNVTGSAGYGIQTSAVTGNTVITNNAAQVSGTTWAATAVSNGTGIITITDGSGAVGTGAGLYAGGTLGGINANLTAANAATTDGIIISGTGNTTSTTGVGINATIVAGNNTNINITRSGTTTVQTAGSTSDGINAVTAGLGSVSVTGVGNVTGGTGAGAVGINAQNTNAGATKGVLVTPAGTVSGTSGIIATNAGTNATSTSTVNSAFNVTASGGNGITTSTVTGLNTVNLTGGTISATADGINSTTTGTGNIHVNLSGGTIGSSIAAPLAGRVGGFGVSATQSGPSGNITIDGTGTPIFSTNDGINATVTGAGSAGSILVTQNGVINSTAGDGINTSITSATATGNITVNANANITATSPGKDGIRSNNSGSGFSAITVANSVTILGDPGIVNDTAGGNATVAVGNSDNINGGVGIINRQNAVAGTGQAYVTVGTGTTVTGDGTTADPLNGYGIYNRNFSTAAHAGAETAPPASSPSSAWVVTGNGDTINATAAAVAGAGVSGIYNQAAGATAEVNFNSATGVGTTSTINVNATGFGSSFGINNSSASTTAGDVIKVTTGNSSSIKLTTGNTNSNVGILSSGTGATGTAAVSVTTGTSSVINVTADGSATVNAAAGNNNIGISALASGGAGNASPVTVTTGTSSAINIGNGNSGIGVNASTSGIGLVSVTTGTSSTITLGTGTGGVGINATNTGAIAGNVSAVTGTSSSITVTGTGGESGILASTTGTGNVTATNGNSATITVTDTGALTSAGIRTSATSGTTTIGNTGTVTVTGGSGVNATTTSGPVGITNGDVAGTNPGTIIGDGTVLNPVIAVSETSGNTTITNNTGSVIRSNNATANNQPADLAINVTATTTGNATIANAGTLNGRISLTPNADGVTNTGTWNLRDNGGAFAASFGAGTDSLTNTNPGVINAGNLLAAATTTFDSIETIGNSGTVKAGLFNTNDVTIFQTSAIQTVTNTGTFLVHGRLSFTGAATSSFANAGGLLDMRSSGAATTDITTLNSTVGTGVLSNTYTPGVAYNFTGGANSRLGVDAFLGSRTNSVPWSANTSGSDVPADRLIISGNADTLPVQSPLATGVLVNDTNGPNGAAYNPTGITIVGVNGTSANAFRLTSITCNGVDITTYCASTGDLLQAARGPMGAIKKGFWFYPLLQTANAQAVADGLPGASSSEYRLYGLPDIETYQLAKLTTGLQNAFSTTAGDWLDRQNDLHHWIRRGAERARNADGSGQDSAPGYLSSTGPGVWLKATGSWTNRKSSGSDADLVAVAGVLPAFDTGYKQNTYSLQGGFDFGRESVFRPTDAFVIGLVGGYIDSTMKFNDGTNSLHLSGGTAGISATYLSGGFFADGLLKADLLNVGINFGSLAQFGFGAPTVHATNLGGLGNIGYRFEFYNAYFEPALTGTFVQTKIDSITSLGTGVSFPGGQSLRGAAGARLGAEFAKSPTETLDLSITGRFWDEFTSKGGAVFTTTGPTLTLNDPHNKTYVEVQGLADFKNSATGWSSFLMGGVLLGSQNTTITGKAGSRYQW